MLGQIKSSQNSSSQGKTGKVNLEQVKSSWDMSSQVRTGEFKLWQVKSGQVKLGFFCRQKFCWTNIWTQNAFWSSCFWIKNCLGIHFFGPKLFLGKKWIWPTIWLNYKILNRAISFAANLLWFEYWILIHKPKCTWKWSLTLALAQLVLFCHCLGTT